MPEDGWRRLAVAGIVQGGQELSRDGATPLRNGSLFFRGMSSQKPNQSTRVVNIMFTTRFVRLKEPLVAVVFKR